MLSFSLLMIAAMLQSGAPCSLQGWSDDTDPAGLRVRAGPSITAREIGRLPAAVQGGDRYAPEFDILDVKNGWVKIANASDPDAPKPRPTYKGVGWVHGSRVAFTLQTDKGRAGPSVRAPILVQSEGFEGDAGARVQPIIGCSGGWVRLRYTLPAEARATKGPRSGEAWFGAVCANQHTTCDRLSEEKSKPGISR